MVVAFASSHKQRIYEFSVAMTIWETAKFLLLSQIKTLVKANAIKIWPQDTEKNPSALQLGELLMGESSQPLDK